MKICVRCSKEYQQSSNAQRRCDPCRIIHKRENGLQRAAAWYEENKDRKRAYDAKRRKEKRHLYRAASKRWRENNPSYKKAETITRRQGIKQQTPPWANKKYMDLFYFMAKQESERLGKAVHVDHIIPLCNELVCGLHCEDNMQLLLATENMKKNNHYSLEHEGRR